MKKVRIYAACAVALMTVMGACTKEDFSGAGSQVPSQEPVSLEGEVIVKFAPYVGDILDRMGEGIATRSGILPVDEVLDLVGGYELERVFPSDPRFVEKERKAGLNLWYVVRFDDSRYGVEDVISKLSSVGEVQAAVPNRIIKRAYDPKAKPVPFTPAATRAGAWTDPGAFNDQFFKYQWDLVNRGEDNGSVYTVDSGNSSLADLTGEAFFGKKFVKDVDVNLFSEGEGSNGAWGRCTGDPSVIVAVLDEGVCLEHPDLMANIWSNTAELPGNGIDDDGNGYIDDVNGFNFIVGNGQITWNDIADTGHGTHVAGTIAAVNNNSIGISSIAGGTLDAPGVKIMSCQVFSGEMASNSVSLVKAIKYAADNGAVVLQCSFGYNSGAANPYIYGQGFRTQEEWEEQSPLEKIALEYFVNNAGSPNGPIDGGIAVFASGNEYAPAAGFPGAADFCVSVAAVAGDGTPSTYTNYSTGTSISAPGGDRDYYYEYLGTGSDGIGADGRGAVGTVLSTLPEHVSASGYGYMEGTSMACPHVSGVVALGISYAAQKHRHFTSEEFRQMLFDSANRNILDQASSGKKYYYTYISDLGLAQRTYFDMNQYKGQMGTGLVDAGALLDMIDGGAGVAMKFPNIYVAAGAEVTADAGFYIEGTEFSVAVADESVATVKEVSEGKFCFKGVSAGITTATLTYSGGSQDFTVTVRNTVGEGWL